ncbi:MAG: YjbH domain-containing protein, partial [Pseudomonadota bacterium]
RLAVGAELNYVGQRDFDQGFGLQDYRTTTGHVSFYYRTLGEYYYQLDLGRYLAEDWGGTLNISRAFGNGVAIGVFATLTDMPFEDFGEGSFDKGFRIQIPFSALTGDRRTGGISRTIRPVLRDGGARVSVPGRLYGNVAGWHEPVLREQWGRFWR